MLHGVIPQPSCAAFAPDGQTLTTLDAGRTLLVWDAQAFYPRKAPPAIQQGEAERAHAWETLARGEGSAVHAAIWQLTRDPEGSVAFLKSRLRQADRPTDAEVQRLLRQLSSDHYATRIQATHELEKRGDTIEVPLRQARAGETRAECRRRLEGLLERIDNDRHPDWLQRQRAIEVLEKIDHAGAREILESLSRGPTEARLTREARAALARRDRLR
jgi:hypothetical protein